MTPAAAMTPARDARDGDAGAGTGAGAGAASKPRSDLVAAACWMAFGAAVAAGAWHMDRLENQDVPPYAVPGLLPFFLGLAIVGFGSAMLVRAARHGAFRRGAARAAAMSGPERRRLVTVLALCLTFAVVLVGHGLPFPVAAAAFVAVTMFVLQYRERRSRGEVLRGAVVAAVTGAGAGIGVTVVFQDIFLVHLP